MDQTNNSLIHSFTHSLIEIKGYGAVSPLGLAGALGVSQKKGITIRPVGGVDTAVGALSLEAEKAVEGVAAANPLLKQVDRSVLLAVCAARQAVQQAGWETQANEETGVNIGSSRGATATFEKHFQAFQTGFNHQVSPSTSPLTTLGNISSWVAQDLQADGPLISHSITCSTAHQAIANAMAWLRSGMATRFLAGGSEAALTPFTVAQMKALGIYSSSLLHPYPSRPCNSERENTFVLGEGAAVFALELVPAASLAGSVTKGRIIIESLGFGFEPIKSKTGISEEGLHFQKAMAQAMTLSLAPTAPPDLILLHAPGTVAGDAAELNAIQAVFGSSTPTLCSNKWQIGHSLGASAALSLAQAIEILQQQQAPTFPYAVRVSNPGPKVLNRIMINAAGFGGNAASLLLSRSA
jgi:3-oxoacyl-[acyl-carrier-protein] synthase II